MEPTRRGRGRPRCWRSNAEKHRSYRARQRERQVLLLELLHAVRNAHWEDPELQGIINVGDDAEVLKALIAHYRARYWMTWDPNQRVQTKEEEGTIDRAL